MGDEKSSTISTASSRDRELLIPVADDDVEDSKPSSSASSSHLSGRDIVYNVDTPDLQTASKLLEYLRIASN